MTENLNSMVDFLCRGLWKSLLDLRWGFNHLVLTKRAAELMTIISSLGLLEPTVLNSGIHNGPTAMQTCINGTYEAERAAGNARAFIDDLGLTTGQAGDPRIPDPLDTTNPAAVKAFEDHLVLLGVIDEGGGRWVQVQVGEGAFRATGGPSLGVYCWARGEEC